MKMLDKYGVSTGAPRVFLASLRIIYSQNMT
jgi:hypothetical protein